MNIVKVKKLAFDFGTNILASMIVTVTMQLLIYPLIARNVSVDMYGLILTIMGIANTIVMALGSTLNNIRLVQNKTYESMGIQGDFNIILVAISIIGAISIIAVMAIWGHITLINIILLMFAVVLGIIKSYYLVDYRLKLNFTLNLLCNVVIAVGYVVGLLLFYITTIWVIPFLMGEIFACAFLFVTTKLIKEPLRITATFKQTLSMYFMLILTGAIATALSYMDRLIIFPILGGKAVSIFTVASFFGKSIGLVMTPIASVLLSYYSQKNFKFTIKLFWLINIYVLIFSTIFMGISCIVSNWITGLLYPSIIASAKPYIFISNLAAIVGITANMTQPAVLKFAPMFWQIVIQIIYGVIYIILGIYMLKFYGIYGFCISIMFASIIRLILLYSVGHIYVKKENAYE